MVVFVVHNSGDLMTFKFGILVGVVCLFDILDVLTCLLSFADGLLAFRTVFDWTSKNSVALFIHCCEQRINNYLSLGTSREIYTALPSD